MVQNRQRRVKQTQTVIYWSALMNCMADVADFLTVAGRKYGC